MILHHVSLGTRDVPRAVSFYDAVLKALGYRRVMEFMPYAVAYGVDHPDFWIQVPADQGTASVGNGVHVAFGARTRAQVNAFHAAALAQGGTDEGAPGLRPDYGPDYYGAFCRDLDGNKIEACVVKMPDAKASSNKSTAKKAAAKKAPAKKKPVKAKPKSAKKKTAKRK